MTRGPSGGRRAVQYAYRFAMESAAATEELGLTESAREWERQGDRILRDGRPDRPRRGGRRS